MTVSELTWRWAQFDQLSPAELYDILRVRQEVFVVEQECAYLDADGRDHQALHLMVRRLDDLVGYLRLLSPGASDGQPAMIGRILTTAAARGQGLGRALVERAVSEAERRWPAASLAMSAQARLIAFYGSLGFEPRGPEYDEDGIPHIHMVRARRATRSGGAGRR